MLNTYGGLCDKNKSIEEIYKELDPEIREALGDKMQEKSGLSANPQSNNRTVQENDNLSVSDLIKAITNLSEAALISANAAMKNAEVNERYSKNMEKMLDMLSEDSCACQKRTAMQGYTNTYQTA